MAQRGWVMILHLTLMCSWAVSCLRDIRFDLAASVKCIYEEIQTNVLVLGDFSMVFFVVFMYINGGFRLCRTVINGPRRYPVVGSLFAFWRNRSRKSEWYAQMLADSPTQTIVLERLGGVQTVVTANPENVEHILKTRFDNYPKGEPFTAILHDLLGNGIFNSDGDAWKLQWKVASHELNTHSIRNFVLHDVEAVTARLLPILEEASKQGSCLDLQDLLQRFCV